MSHRFQHTGVVLKKVILSSLNTFMCFEANTKRQKLSTILTLLLIIEISCFL